MLALKLILPCSDIEWESFCQEVRNTFWLLPKLSRPRSALIPDDLFTGKALTLFPHGGTVSVSASLTISPNMILSGSMHSNDVGWRLLHLTDRRERFFAQTIIVLLHNFCPGYAEISTHLASPSPSWEQPLIWLRKHLSIPELQAPGPISDLVMNDEAINFFLERYHSSEKSAVTERCWRAISWAEEYVIPNIKHSI